MGALDGVRVVEFDAIGPVPLCAMLLADMGADVVRVARAGGQSAYEDAGERVLHRGRTGVVLNLKDAADRDKALELVRAADILIEGFRPGVMERLGLGPEPCLAVNPSIVYGRMTGWGQSGPLAQRAGHDINYLALTGALAALGEAGRPPVAPLNFVGDYAGGAMFLATGVLAALLSAQRTGRGQVVDAAMTDGVAVLSSLFTALLQGGRWTLERQSNLLDGGAPFYRCYVCKDGRHVAVGALEPAFFEVLIDGLGLKGRLFDQYDKARWPEMQGQFAARFSERSRDEWAAVFDGTDACVSPVLDFAEALHHPQNAERAAYLRLNDVSHPAPAPRFSATPSEVRSPTDSRIDIELARWLARGFQS